MYAIERIKFKLATTPKFIKKMKKKKREENSMEVNY